MERQQLVILLRVKGTRSRTRSRTQPFDDEESQRARASSRDRRWQTHAGSGGERRAVAEGLEMEGEGGFLKD